MSIPKRPDYEQYGDCGALFKRVFDMALSAHEHAVAVRAVRALREAVDRGHEDGCDAEMNHCMPPERHEACDCRMVGLVMALREIDASGWTE